VWHAGFENSKEAREIAQEIERLLAQKEDIDERLKKLQQEYEKVTGEPYDAR
jgi:DNA anti-recombination protein RmuC